MEQHKKGYQIESDRERHVLKLRLWGMWDTYLAHQFEHEVQPKILDMEQQSPHGWSVMVNLSQFPPQFQDIQAIIKTVIQFEFAHGMHTGATVVAKTMTQLQIKRLVDEVGGEPGSYFQSEDDAIRWLVGG